MIRKLLIALTLGTSLALGGCLGESSPAETLTQIEELQAKKFDMTQEQKTRVAELVAKGKTALEAGNSEAASTALNEALEILKRARDAALFNKAD
ncbi:MAG: hypothetical protein D6773_18415 [Alphaproteobacteria bacterium]|nr:MAG: hypothetical protein D6773_18415 [Alphaproteobacteria bacterium]